MSAALHMLMVVLLTVVLIASHHMSVDGLSTSSDRAGRKLFGGYRITPKFCRASKTLPRSDPRSHGPTICMFNHECTQRQGEVVGACMDGFLFGACCQISGSIDSPLVVEHEIVQQSAAAQSYETYGLNNKKPSATQAPNTPTSVARPLPTRRPEVKPSTISGQFAYPSAGDSGQLDVDSNNSVDTFGNNGYDSLVVSSPTPDYATRRPTPPATPTFAPDSHSTASGFGVSMPSASGYAEVYLGEDHSEYPTRIPTGGGDGSTVADGGYTPDHYGQMADDILNSQSSEFTHSDITHPGFDTVIVDSHSGYGGQVVAVDTTAVPPTTVIVKDKSTFAAPSFRPKTTKAPLTTSAVLLDTSSSGSSGSGSGYGGESVTVQTGLGTSPGTSSTGNDGGIGLSAGSGPDTVGKPQGTMSDNDIESIESIILMLNDTKTGPQYDSSNASSTSSVISNSAHPSTFSLPTQAITKLPVGSSHQTNGYSQTVGVTEKMTVPTTSASSSYATSAPASVSTSALSTNQRQPSTSYVYSAQPTRRPIQVQSTISSSYGTVNPANYHSVQPSSESITDHILSITKRPVLITAASFATGRPPLSTYNVPDEVTVTGSIPVSSFASTPAIQIKTTPTPATTIIIQSPTKRPPTTRLPSTSYITGPTTPRPQKTPTKAAAPTSQYPSTRKPAVTANASKPTNSPPRRNMTESAVYLFRPTQSSHAAGVNPTVQPSQPQYAVYEHVIQSRPIIQFGGSSSSSSSSIASTTAAPTTSYASLATTIGYDAARPNPTVLITPKPTANQATTNGWTLQSIATTQPPPQLPDEYSTPLIKAPSTSYVFGGESTVRPAVRPISSISSDYPSASGNFNTDTHSSNSNNNINDYPSGSGTTFGYPSGAPTPPSFSHLRPQSIGNDFEDPGYHGATSTFRPASGSGLLSTFSSVDTTTNTQHDDIEEEDVVTAQYDTNNFPPVRNPNLNSTLGGVIASNGGGGGVLADDYDMSTPVFQEDEALNDKMGLLVSKIVESLQGNFEQLADVVYDDVVVPVKKPTRPAAAAAAVTPKPVSGVATKRPTTAAAAAAASVTRPTTRRPTSSSIAQRPAAAAAAASAAAAPPVSGRPTVRPSSSVAQVNAAAAAASASVTKRPTTAGTKVTTAATTSKKPTATNVRRTTKKPAAVATASASTAAAAAATTKKPLVTKVPSTRRPTAKPTRKVIATTTVQPQLLQDEVVNEEEDDDDDDDEDEDEEEEENAVDADSVNVEPAEQTTTTQFAEGRLQCGVRPQIKSGRIVGGKGATFGEFPWQVLVRESTWLGLFTKNKCGGVLISKNYVVTAAHCQPGFLASLVTVFGEFDISGELEAKRSVTKNVKRVVVHREYDAATFENDLAMLELESPIHYDTHIVPICMPSDAADFTGRMATVTGWGRLKYGGGVPSVLQEVQVPIIENSVCQEMFHTAGHNKKILSSFLCAGYANGQKDSCEGDSGGPLVLQRQDGRWELAGTVSHGIKCAAPYLPGVYMRTTYYKPWLQSIAGVH